jgi:hypothetical protein
MLFGFPWTVEVMLDARADRLHQQAQRLAGDFDESLDAQHIMIARDAFDPRGQRCRISDSGKRHDETVEVVVIVIGLGVMMRRPIGEIVFCGGR